VPTLNLSGEQQQRLQKALVAAFPSRFAVEQLVAYRLDYNLNQIVGDVGLDEVVHRVIEWARKCDRLDQLIAKARDENPNNELLNKFVTDINGSGSALADVAAPTREIATRGLAALQDLMQDTEVQVAAREFQSEFESAVRQIELLAVYKDLHDLLHTLQFQSYRVIAHEAKRFPADETAREILLDHSLTLDEIGEQLKEVAGRVKTESLEFVWIQDLTDARSHLKAALDRCEVRELAKTVWLIDRVVAVQPSQINTRLNAVARVLALPELVAALTTLHTRLANGGAAPDKLQEFQAGIASLSELDRDLKARVVEHDRWQGVDLELRRIQTNMRDAIVELDLSWPRLKIMIEPLAACPDAWAAELRAEMMKVDAGLGAQDAVRTRQGFQRFYSQASARFYRVDLALKRVCEGLRTVGTPLAQVLRLLK
jgi:hypothetical protein